MFPICLAPTSAPKRWYSNQHSVQDEFDELAYLEAKFVHDREQALEVRCPMITPPSTFNNTSMNNNNNNNSLDDPSIDDMAPQDGIDNSDIMPSGGLDVSFIDDHDPPTNNNNNNIITTTTTTTNDLVGNSSSSVSFLSQHNEIHSEHPPYYQNSINNYTSPTMISTRSYSTPNRMRSTSHLQPNFFTTPTSTHQRHQATPSSPNLVDYLSPPPSAGRSLRQYMDDSSRGFMEPPEMLDRLIRYDDDDDNNNDPMISIQSQHNDLNNNNDSNHDDSRRLRRSNLFD